MRGAMSVEVVGGPSDGELMVVHDGATSLVMAEPIVPSAVRIIGADAPKPAAEFCDVPILRSPRTGRMIADWNARTPRNQGDT